MPLQKLQFRPGLNREGTDYANEGGFYDGDKIRFRSGYPEKIGGWTQMSNNKYLGVARSMWNWEALNGANNYLGVGTNLKYYIENGGTYNDVTPFYQSDSFVGAASPASGITATNGSAVLTIIDTSASGPAAGDYINISGATGLGGTITAVVLNKEYVVATVTSSTIYTIIAYSSAVSAGSFSIGTQYTIQYVGTTDYTLIGAANNTIGTIFTATGVGTGSGIAGAIVLANGTDTGHGGATTMTIGYQAQVGSAIYSTGSGWGSGPWSRGTWGSGYTVGIGQQLRLWTNDNYGQDLVLAPRGGALYYWKASTGLSQRAVLLSSLSGASSVPLKTNQLIASSIQQFVIAMGADSYSDATHTFNPMLVRWSDQANPVNWTPAVTNQSGEFALTNGSFIMGARTTRQEILIWTDSCLYSMQYLGAPYVWGFSVIMDNISMMSPNAMITVNNITYWMGTDKFYTYSGRVETLPCSLRQYIYTDINKDQAFQVFAGANEGYNEVWWFYCSTGSNTIDKYVIYNYVDRVWYYGSMARTAWLDSGIRNYPMAADYNSRILYHESSVDDEAGDAPVAIYSYVQSSDFDIDDGHNFGFVWRILPDINFNGSTTNAPSVKMTVKPRQNSGTPYGTADNPTVTSGENFTTVHQYTIQEFTGQVYTRLRGRQLSFKIESTGLGVAWQLGLPRIDIRKDGRR